jgi:hypothetical protein
MRGAGVADLAFVFANSVARDLRRRLEDELLRLWHGSVLSATGTPYSFEEALVDFRRCLLFVVVRTVMVTAFVPLGGHAEELAAIIAQRSFDCAIDHGLEDLVAHSPRDDRMLS